MSDKLFGNAPLTSVKETTPPVDDNNQEVDYIELLKKQGRPVDDKSLAKKAVHSDQHIANLESELAGMRQELDKRLSYEQLRDQIAALKTTTPESNPSHKPGMNSDGNSEPNKQPSQDDILKLVRDTLNQESQRQKQTTNINVVRNTLENAWGKGFEAKLRQRAAEIGVDEGFLESLAAQQPKAFFELVGVKATGNVQPAQFSSAPPSSSINASSASSNSSIRNKDYYDRLRATDPKLYWSRDIQAEKHRNALRLGEDFFSSKK